MTLAGDPVVRCYAGIDGHHNIVFVIEGDVGELPDASPETTDISRQDPDSSGYQGND